MTRKLLIGFGLTFVVLIGILLAIPFLFKDKIIAKVKEEANKQLLAKMDFGSFDLTLIRSFPNMQFTLNDFSLAGIDEFKNDTLVSIEHFSVNMDLMSVIKGEQIKVNGLILENPRIRAWKLANGKANWNITKATPPSQETPEESSAFKLSLKKLSIENGLIKFDDDSSGYHAFIKGMNYTLSGDFSDAQTVLENALDIERLDFSMGGITYFSKTKVKFDAEIDADLVKSKYVFKNNTLSLNALELGWNGWVEMPANDISMDLSFAAAKSEFKQVLSLVPAVFMKDFEQVKTNGTFTLNGFAKGIYNEKLLPSFGINLKVEKGYFKYPDLPRDAKNISLDLKVNGNKVPDNTVVDIRNFHVELGENPVDMKMLIKTPISDADINGEIKGKINLGSLSDVIPLEKDENLNGLIIANIALAGKQSMLDKKEYEKFKADGKIEMSDVVYNTQAIRLPVEIKAAVLSFSPRFLDLSKFEANVGKSDLNLKGKIENFLAYYFKNEPLTGDFSFQSNLLNAAELMANVPEEGEPAPPDTAATTAPEIPANLNLKMTAAIGKLLYDTYELTNVKGSVSVSNQTATLSNFKFNIIDGTVGMNGKYVAQNILRPLADFDLNLSNFDIQKTVKTFNTVEKLAPIGTYCKGTFSTTLKVATALDYYMNPDLKTLNGYGKLSTKNINVSGFEPLNKVADAIKMTQYKQLNLNDVNVDYEIRDGRVTVKPFDVAIGKTKTNIAGSTGLDQTIDYNMVFSIPTSEMPAQAMQVANNLFAEANKLTGTQLKMGEKVDMNVKLGGTITKPVIKTSVGNAGKNALDNVKDQAEELAKQKLKEAEEKARQEADKVKKQAEAEAEKLKQQAEQKKKELEAKAKAEADKVKAEAERKKKEAEEKVKAEAEKAKKAAEEKAKKEAEKGLKNLFPGKK